MLVPHCLAGATGHLTVPRDLMAGERVTIAWTSMAPCSVTRHIVGPGFAPAEPLMTSGRRTVTMAAAGPARWTLQLVAKSTGRSVVVDDHAVMVRPTEFSEESVAIRRADGPMTRGRADAVTAPKGP